MKIYIVLVATEEPGALTTGKVIFVSADEREAYYYMQNRGLALGTLRLLMWSGGTTCELRSTSTVETVSKRVQN